MSAHIVDHSIIDAILVYAKPEHLEALGVATKQELGQILLDENVRSYNTRYPDDVQETFPYKYTKLSERDVEPRGAISCINNLDYQSCETDDWLMTQANECLGHIEADIIRDHYYEICFGNQHGALLGARHPLVATAAIEAGADVNSTDNEGNCPLHWVRSVDVADVLIADGAVIDAKGENGQTPLHNHAKVGFELKVVERLIEAGADVDAMSWEGHTPLHLTAIWGSSEMAELLLAHDANPLIRNKRGQMPFEMADPDLTPKTYAILKSAAENRMIRDGVSEQLQTKDIYEAERQAVEEVPCTKRQRRM